MVKKTLLSMVVVTFLLAAPRPAIAGCIKDFQDGALAAALRIAVIGF